MRSGSRAARTLKTRSLLDYSQLADFLVLNLRAIILNHPCFLTRLSQGYPDFEIGIANLEAFSEFRSNRLRFLTVPFRIAHRFLLLLLTRDIEQRLWVAFGYEQSASRA